MTAAHLNFDNEQVGHIEQGATWRFTFSWRNSNGTDIEMSDYTAKMQVRKNFSGDLITELSTDNGKIYFDSDNRINLALTAEETQLLPPGKYVYDLEVYEINGDKVVRLLEGQFRVSPEITL